MAQLPYHNANALEYAGTTSKPPTPYTRRTTDKHKGTGKGRDIKSRTTTIALSDCVVTRADGTKYVIESTRNRATAKRKAKVATQTARALPEVSRISFRDAKQLFGN